MTRSIEEILEQSPLRKPGESLDQRLDDLFNHSNLRTDRQTRPGSNRWRWAMSITTLAAALTMVAMLWQPWSTPTIPSHPIGPTDQIPSPMANMDAPTIRFDQTRIDITPGDVFLVNRIPVRLLHRQSVDQTQWIDEFNNVRIELTVPKEDYFIVPVKID